MIEIEQLRADRSFALNGWRMGGANGSERWDGDDGRSLSENDIIWMKLRLADGNLDEAVAAKYTIIINAEQAEFDRLNAIFDEASS